MMWLQGTKQVLRAILIAVCTGILSFPVFLPAATPLDDIPGIARLPQAELAKSLPVRIEGRITLVLPGRKVVYLDADGVSIAVKLSKELSNLVIGRSARVEGNTIANRAWRIIGNKIQLLEDKQIVSETPILSVAEFLDAPRRQQVVELRGVVRQRKTSYGSSDIVLTDGSQSIAIKIFGVSTAGEPKRLLYSTSRIRGVAIQQGKNLLLETFGWSSVQVETPEAKFPFQVPLLTIADVLQIPRDEFPPQCVKIRGRLSELRSDGGILLNAGADRIELVPPTDEDMEMEIGNVIEALGFVSLAPDGESIQLEQVRTRTLGLPYAVAKDPAHADNWPRYVPLIGGLKRVRSLSREYLEFRPPVRASGNIMHVDPTQKKFVLQDAHAGVEVVSFQADFAVRPGAHVRVVGHAQRGSAATVIGDAKVTRLSDSRIADAIVPTVSGLAAGNYDGTWIELTGVGRRFQKNPEGHELQLAHEGSSITVRFPAGMRTDEVGDFVDAWIRVVGLAQTIRNGRGEASGTAINVSNRKGVTILDAAPAIESIEELPIAALGRVNPGEQFTRRYRTRGSVVLAWPNLVYLSDGTNSVRVFPVASTSVKAGQLVQAVGFPNINPPHADLNDAVIMPTEKIAELSPRSISSGERLATGNPNEFIEVDANLVKQVAGSSEAVLIVRSGAETFSASLPKSLFNERLMSLLEGSRLRLRGVLNIETDSNGRNRTARLLLPDAKAVVLLQAPPWWTVERLLSALALMAFAVTLALWRSVRLQRQVADSEGRLTSAALASPVAVVIISAKDGRILEINDRFRTDLGFARKEDVIGQSLEGMGVWSDPNSLKRLQRIAASKDEHLHTTWKTGDAKPRAMVLSAEALEFDSHPCLVVSGVDVTEKTELLEQLRDSQKMEAVGQLAAGVAHDFNNLLTIIQGNAEIIEEELEKDSPIHEFNEEVVQAGSRAAELTRQLLAFSRKQVLLENSLELGDVIHSSVRMLRRLLPETVAVEFEKSDEQHWIRADRGMLEQILINLAVNARDAISGPGTVSLTIDETELDADEAEIYPDAAPGRFVRLTISDTGEGMDQATQARIFEPFFTTKDVGKGTGLGLSTVYGIIRQHHGWINVTSEPQRGTSFQIYLPRSEPKQPEDTDETPTDTNLRGDEKVLLVEDESSVRRITAAVLTRAGYDVVQAEDGVAALAEWEQQDGGFDLLLSDVLMPNNVNGVELAHRLFTMKPNLKVILISGYSDDNIDSAELDQMGAIFINKPVAQDELLGRMRDLFDAAPAVKS